MSTREITDLGGDMGASSPTVFRRVQASPPMTNGDLFFLTDPGHFLNINKFRKNTDDIKKHRRLPAVMLDARGATTAQRSRP